MILPPSLVVFLGFLVTVRYDQLAVATYSSNHANFSSAICF